MYSNFLGKCECNFAFFFLIFFGCLHLINHTDFLSVKCAHLELVLLQRLLSVKRE